MNKKRILQSVRLLINRQTNKTRRGRKLFLTIEIKLTSVDRMRTDEGKKPTFCNHQERVINRC